MPCTTFYRLDDGALDEECEAIKFFVSVSFCSDDFRLFLGERIAMIAVRFYAVFVVCSQYWIVTAMRDVEAEKNPEFWKTIAKEELHVALRNQKQNNNAAKNVILFLGDGMGIPTVTSGRIFKGQLRGESGEETKLAMDNFPHAALSRVYSADKQVPDSAATGTAYLCGVKANYGTIGVNSAVESGNCQSAQGNEVESVLIDFWRAGRSTGIVTTTRINHASPSAAYAHSANRRWYGDADLPEEAKVNGCKDMALQFYEASDKITVAMGGGRKFFQPNNTKDPEYPSKANYRADGQDLIEMWKNKMENARLTTKYVWNKNQFDAVDAESTDRLLGLFEPSEMNYEADRAEDGSGEPSLAEMTKKAIEILRKNDEGYFLFVEGGRIDHAHHGGNAFLALHDLVAFDNAIQQAVDMTSEEETLIIVTADHSHVFTMGGYSDRGNDILGLAPGQGSPKNALDSKPYTTLLYANGPGFQGHHKLDPATGYTVPVINDTFQREDLGEVDTTAHDYTQQSAVPLSSETHGGEDVPILAKGPMAHLFHGVHEQMYIAYVMRYASCTGPNQEHCGSGRSEVPTVDYLGGEVTNSEAENILIIQFAFLMTLTAIILILILFIIVSRRTQSQKVPIEMKQSTQS